MRNRKQRVLVAVAILLMAVTLTSLQVWNGKQSIPGDMVGNLHPPIMLWAWEAPTRLDWLDTDKVGVAYLSETIQLTGNSLECKPRMQPLVVPKGTYRMAVVRIERNNKKAPTLSDYQLEGLVNRIVRRAGASGAQAVQIDFDARKSERGFYRRLLSRLRKELPASTTLSMTALASWCIGDRWMSDLSVDEIVPMFFSMGADRSQVLMHLRQKGSVSDFGKKLGIGLADDKEMNLAVSQGPARSSLQRGSLFLFSGRAWTEEKARRLVAEIGL